MKITYNIGGDNNIPPEKKFLSYQKLPAEAYQLRIEKGINLTDIAKKTRMGRANLHKLETSGQNVRLKTLVDYLGALDCSLVIVPRSEMTKNKTSKGKFKTLLLGQLMKKLSAMTVDELLKLDGTLPDKQNGTDRNPS